MDFDEFDIGSAVVKHLKARPEATRFPVQPPPGSVLRFEHAHDNGDKLYTYVGIRTANGWHLTGRRTPPMDWPALVEFIGNATCHLVTEYAKIPHLPTDPRDEIGDPRAWFDTVFGDKPEK